MKRRTRRIRNKRPKRYKGGASKCQKTCKQTCPTTCRKLCHVAKDDTAYYENELAELLVIKEELKNKILNQNKQQIDNFLNKESYTDKEKETLRKILEGDTDVLVKRILLDKIKNTSRYPILKGGFKWLEFKQKDEECETDCTKKCSESCDYLCKESVSKKGNKHAAQIKMVTSEIEVLRSLLSQIGI
jgi:hypothetical protein